MLQSFRRFTYVTAHSPILPLLHLRHSSFSNHSVASPTSQLILQSFRCFTYVTAHSPVLSLLLRHMLLTYVTWRAAHDSQFCTSWGLLPRPRVPIVKSLCKFGSNLFNHSVYKRTIFEMCHWYLAKRVNISIFVVHVNRLVRIVYSVAMHSIVTALLVYHKHKGSDGQFHKATYVWIKIEHSWITLTEKTFNMLLPWFESASRYTKATLPCLI